MPFALNSLEKGEIHIWGVNLSEYTNYCTYYYAILSADEQTRANKYKFEHHKRYFILARGILRELLSRYLLIYPQDIKFSYGPYGKPNLDSEKNNLSFNISHAGDVALYIISQVRAVGIDIEKIKPLDNCIDLAERFFTPNESKALRLVAAADRLECFFKCWTRKEAFIKLIGEGLTYPLNQFEVSVLPNEPAALKEVYGNPELVKKLHMRDLITFPGYVATFIFEKICQNIVYTLFIPDKK